MWAKCFGEDTVDMLLTGALAHGERGGVRLNPPHLSRFQSIPSVRPPLLRDYLARALFPMIARAECESVLDKVTESQRNEELSHGSNHSPPHYRNTEILWRPFEDCRTLTIPVEIHFLGCCGRAHRIRCCALSLVPTIADVFGLQVPTAARPQEIHQESR